MYQEDTIAAVATAVGEGGVAIIRISGPDAERLATRVFERTSKSSCRLRSHMLYQGVIREPQSGQLLDQVLVVIMRGPRSYTGEDVVEIHCHGGVFLVRRILGVVLAQGARHAERGEFTKRAFLNGRIDLSQAEAVLDLIQARTDKSVDLAVQNVNGLLSRSVGALREELLDILVQIEAAIDFPDEEIELLQRPVLIQRIDALCEKIRVILDSYAWGKLHREGARVCICGRPNVGKSSLLNALLGAERAIVSAVPGTTRDIIEDSLDLDGLPILIWDTAGIRDTDEAVEKIGVGLTHDHIKKADMVVAVLDGSQSLTQDDVSMLTEINGAKTILAVNKSDLRQNINLQQTRHLVPEAMVLSVSAQNGDGIDALKTKLRQLLLGAAIESPTVLGNLRQKNSLTRGYDQLHIGMAALKDEKPPEIVAVNLHEAKQCLEEVIGIMTNEDILEHIFSNFCIGK